MLLPYVLFYNIKIIRVMIDFTGGTEDLLNSLKAGGVLVTSYSGILIHKELLLKFKWHYIILDEGHKIRNPDAKVCITYIM
jgi:SNF2 family DNA or RNA helicase